MTSVGKTKTIHSKLYFQFSVLTKNVEQVFWHIYGIIHGGWFRSNVSGNFCCT